MLVITAKVAWTEWVISGCCWGQAEPLGNIHRDLLRVDRTHRHALNPDRHLLPDPAKVPRLLGFPLVVS